MIEDPCNVTMCDVHIANKQVLCDTAMVSPIYFTFKDKPANYF